MLPASVTGSPLPRKCSKKIADRKSVVEFKTCALPIYLAFLFRQHFVKEGEVITEKQDAARIGDRLVLAQEMLEEDRRSEERRGVQDVCSSDLSCVSLPTALRQGR